MIGASHKVPCNTRVVYRRAEHFLCSRVLRSTAVDRFELFRWMLTELLFYFGEFRYDNSYRQTSRKAYLV